MMKFSDHPDHNRNIAVTFDDEQPNLPKQMVITVKYTDDEPCGAYLHKAIRLDNEVMYLLKSAPNLLDACQKALICIRDERPGLAGKVLSKAITQATRTTYL